MSFDCMLIRNQGGYREESRTRCYAQRMAVWAELSGMNQSTTESTSERKHPKFGL